MAVSRHSSRCPFANHPSWEIVLLLLSANSYHAAMKKTARLFLCCVLLLCSSLVHTQELLFADHPLAGRLWDANSRSFIDEAALQARLDTTDVLLLGETHDNPQHHEFQQKLLQARIAAGARPALLMEQLDNESQSALNAALANTARDEALSTINGLIKFSNRQDYTRLLSTAYDSKLPVIAANVASQRLQPVIWRGFGALEADELKRLAIEAVWSDRRQQYMLNNMGGAHCGQLRDELREGLTRSQRLRDALLVDNALGKLAQGIVAIVGRDHARRDVGLPLYFTARAPSTHVLTVGMVEVLPGKNEPEAYLGASASDQPPYDVIWFSARVDRPNPCADLKK